MRKQRAPGPDPAAAGVTMKLCVHSKTKRGMSIGTGTLRNGETKRRRDYSMLKRGYYCVKQEQQASHSASTADI
jgi:hypothetical protein